MPELIPYVKMPYSKLDVIFKIAQWVKALVSKPDNLGLTPGTGMIQRELTLANCSLTSTHTVAHICGLLNTHTHT